MDQIKEHTVANIVADLLGRLSEQDKREILEFDEEDLILLHSSLGRTIRNEYELWSYEWEPVLVDGVDMSPYHPDAVSQEVIHRMWSQLQLTMR